MANSVDPDEMARYERSSGSTLFAQYLFWSVGLTGLTLLLLQTA